MHFCKKMILLAMTCLPVYAYCADIDASNVTSNDEAALIGRWQDGLSSKKPAKSVNGGVIEFMADHTLRLYLKCGPSRSELEKHGVNYLSGDWKISDNHELHVAFHARDKSLERNVKFDVHGDDLIFVSRENPHEQFGKFNGDVPLPCPK